jgi:hypothetical protein
MRGKENRLNVRHHNVDVGFIVRERDKFQLLRVLGDDIVGGVVELSLDGHGRI